MPASENDWRAITASPHGGPERFPRSAPTALPRLAPSAGLAAGDGPPPQGSETRSKEGPSPSSLRAPEHGEQRSGSSLHHIVIVGGGAGGIELATKLGDGLGRRKMAQITLVERTRTHIWKPQIGRASCRERV